MPFLSHGAQAELDALQQEYEGLVDPGDAPLDIASTGTVWHTFAGGRENYLLAEGLRRVGGGRWSLGNLSLKLREGEPTGARSAIERLSSLD